MGVFHVFSIVQMVLNRAKHRSKSVASLEAYSKPCQTEYKVFKTSR